MFYNDDFRQNEFGYGDGIDININNTNPIASVGPANSGKI